MSDIRLDSSVAKAIARILQMDEAFLAMPRTVHGVLADILLTAPLVDEAPVDADLRRSLRERLHAEGGTAIGLVDFHARDGVLEIRGIVGSERDRQRLLQIARSAPGVRHVRDHLVWVDLLSHAFMPSTEDSCPG